MKKIGSLLRAKGMGQRWRFRKKKCIILLRNGQHSAKKRLTTFLMVSYILCSIFQIFLRAVFRHSVWAEALSLKQMVCNGGGQPQDCFVVVMEIVHIHNFIPKG